MHTFWNPDTRPIATPWRILLLGLILTVGSCLRLHDLRNPWPEESLHGYNGAYNSISARNYLRYGPWNLRLVQLWEGGPVTDESPRYYNHPPLVPLLVALSFKIFRTDREWSARLVPILFSIATLVLLYRIGRRVWGEVIALPATLILALVPMATYYASNVCYEPLLIFFALLAFYFYARYLEQPTTGRWAAMLGAIALGALTDWTIFYCVPLFWFFSLVYQRPPRKAILFGLPILSVLTLAAVITFALDGRWDVFKSNLQTNIPLDPQAVSVTAKRVITLPTWLRRVTEDNLYFHTYPILILSMIWAARFLRRAARRQAAKEETFIGALLLFGVMNIVLGWRGVIDHTYWASLITPGLAVASAAISVAAYDGLMRWTRRARPLLAAGGLALLLTFGYISVQNLHAIHEPNHRGQEVGAVLQHHTRFEEVILTSEDWAWPIYSYYADRNIIGDIHTIALFADNYMENPRARYFVLPAEKQGLYPELYGLLDRAFASQKENELRLFDLSAPKLDETGIASLIQTMRPRYSFAEHLDRIKVTPAEQPVPPEQAVFEIDGVRRTVLLQKPESQITFESIPVGSCRALRVGLAINPEVWEQPNTDTTFEIRRTDEQGERVIFSRHVDPFTTEMDRTWIEAVIPLQTASRAMTLTFTLHAAAQPADGAPIGGWYTLSLVTPDTESGNTSEEAR